jgi:hypothetical protein
MFQEAPKTELVKIPYRFRYHFLCDEQHCTGHALSCTDWELGWSYVKWRSEYGKGWEAKLRETFEDKMIEKNETHFFVGTMRSHPQNWIIVGLFYPKR